MRKIQGTPAVTSARKPECPECVKEMLFDPTENVVRLGRRWACRVHYKIKKGHETKLLGEWFVNRQHRRHGVRKVKAAPQPRATA